MAGGGSVTPGDGDGSPASLLSLTTPRNVAVDAGGNLYISDFDAHRIYRVDANGVFTTVAGTGEAGNSGDGAAARDAQLSHPAGLAVDYTGTLYIADWGNGRVRRLIGRTLWSWSGILDSPPTGLAVDPAGDLLYRKWRAAAW